MCHINLIKRKDELPDKRINQLMDVMSLYSFTSNSDGEGYIGITSNNVKVDRSLNKIKYGVMNNFHTLMTHQRFSTSGFNLGNTHPHEGQYFIIQHNGVFSGLGNKDKSDTKFYLEKLELEYEKCSNIIMAIKNSTKNIGGSFSIILFDKKTLKTYYYKNKATTMHKLESNKFLLMSTSEKNLEVAKIFLGLKGKIDNVKSGNIYEVTVNGLKFVSKLGLEDVKQSYFYDWDRHTGYSWNKENIKNDLKDIKELKDYQKEASEYQKEASDNNDKDSEWRWPIDY